jgi:hypothetical protein
MNAAIHWLHICPFLDAVHTANLVQLGWQACICLTAGFVVLPFLGPAAHKTLCNIMNLVLHCISLIGILRPAQPVPQEPQSWHPCHNIGWDGGWSNPDLMHQHLQHMPTSVIGIPQAGTMDGDMSCIMGHTSRYYKALGDVRWVSWL